MTNRRLFIKQSSFALAALAITPSCVWGASSQKTLGIQLYSLRDILEGNPVEVLKKVANIGYKQVEVYGYNSGKFWGLEVKELKNILAANGLESPSGHYGMDDFLSGTKDNLDEMIEVSKQLNHKYLVIPALKESLRQSADDYKKLAKQFNAIGEKCKVNGLKLGYHNHDYEFIKYGSQTGYDILLQNTNPALVDFEMDIYWVARAGLNPVDLFNKYPNRFVMWHIKDMDKQKPQLNTEIGNGSIDFKKIFAERKSSGIKYYYLEQENFNIDPFESINKSYQYLQKELL
jgi:sugar phosphate isomerase/epimerase